jgi:Flp pilus assembly protein TadD
MKEGPRRCLRCGEALSGPEAAKPSAWRQFALRHRGRLLFGGTVASLIGLLLLVASERRPPIPVATAPVRLQPVRSSPPPAAGQTSVDVSLRPFSEPTTALDSSRAGAAAYFKGNFSGALEQYQRAVEKNPNDPRSLNDLGQVLVRLGRTKEALPHFNRAIELNPSEWAPRFNLANAYGKLADWPRAIAEYQRAAELFPDDYVTHYNLAMAFHKAGQEAPAVAEFRRAIALAPSEPSFRLSLGISYERLNRPAEAAKAYEEYLEIHPAAPDAAKIRSYIETLRKLA